MSMSTTPSAAEAELAVQAKQADTQRIVTLGIDAARTRSISKHTTAFIINNKLGYIRALADYICHIA